MYRVISSCGLEKKAETPEGDSARWRPRRLAEEAPAAPLGKRSHLLKSTAVSKQRHNSHTFSVASNEVRRLPDRPRKANTRNVNLQE
ncbi:hypothetical protein FZC75_14590 [Sutcliffiella horikoshii]|uniref:Uncharacterized protein n=1 Tax=Sutcliffiella horikoshii TaxID=79883 RepID=A0A5D4T695_9BACI|nr:hypothetical protein FZC75_14590 [Sutcliffiella horikoshii]